MQVPQSPQSSPPEDNSRRTPGGLIHTYLAYDPKNFPSPTAPPPDLAGAAFEHMLAYGSLRRLTDEELARAVKIDPSMIGGLGPNLDALMAMLLERKQKILSTYETEKAVKDAEREYKRDAAATKAPAKLRDEFERSSRAEQIRDLERMWYRIGDDTSDFATELMRVIDKLRRKYQVDELASKYEFTGRTPMSVDKAIEVKEELEAIDKLIEQLKEAMKNAQIGIIDMDELSRFAEPGEVEQLNKMHERIKEYMRQQAELQGLEAGADGYRLTPQAFRLFQGKILSEIFSSLEAARSGRHQGPIVGEGVVEMQRTKQYEFGDPVSSMDIPGSFVNAMVRARGERVARGEDGPASNRIDLTPADIQIHHTKNNPKCATAVLLDMSGSMRHDGLYVDAKRMALALDGLIRREYPGDFLQFIEVYSLAKPRHVSEVASLMPKPVTIHQSVVRLKADMSKPEASEFALPLHFTNIQRGLQLARQFLSAQDTPNRQVMLITDGLPTAHFEGQFLYLLYPPDPMTERATMREAMLCRKENITINIFLLPNWSQSEDDVQFAHKMAEATRGRVFFAGRNLDRHVLWDYVSNRRKIIG